MTINSRQILGPMMHTVCFQYLRLITEDVAGRAPIVAAGRKRGYDVMEQLGLLGSTQDSRQIQAKLDEVLGRKGTCLCLVQSVTVKPNGGYEVHITESACTAGQTSSAPLCAYTLGIFIGAIHALTGTRMNGYETECQAMGAPMCIYQIDPV